MSYFFKIAQKGNAHGTKRERKYPVKFSEYDYRTTAYHLPTSLCYNNWLFCGNFECARTDMKQNRFIIIRKCYITKCGPAKITKRKKMQKRKADLEYNDPNKRSQSPTFMLKIHLLCKL